MTEHAFRVRRVRGKIRISCATCEYKEDLSPTGARRMAKEIRTQRSNDTEPFERNRLARLLEAAADRTK